MTTRPGYVWDATASEWVEIGQAAVVSPFKYQTSQPSSPATGDIWIDSDEDIPSVDSTLYYRWTKTMSGGETSLSGTDNNSLALKYTPGYESVFINGVLQVRGQDYVATTGTTVTGLIALTANDVVMVESIVAYSVGDTYTQTTLDGKFATQANFPAGAWASYTPVVSGTGWGIGNGTRTGKYAQFGKTIYFSANITFGSTSTYGSGGVVFISLPVSGNAGTENLRFVSFDTSTSTQYFNQSRFENSTTIVAVTLNANGSVSGYFTNTNPFTWATGDSITVTGTYEAA